MPPDAPARDAALIVIDVQEAIDDPRWGPRNNPDAEAIVAALLAAWRAEGLPIIHIRHDLTEPASPYRPERRVIVSSRAAPLEGETVIGKRRNSAFVARVSKACSMRSARRRWSSAAC